MALRKCKECGEAVSSKAAQCPKCGAPAKKKTSLFTWLVLVLIGLMVVSYYASGPSEVPRAASTPAAPSASELERKNVTLEYAWGAGGFKNVMLMNLTVTNENPYPIKDVALACTMYAKSGTGLGTNRQTLYEVIPPGGKLSLREFNMGLIHSQADSASCRISNVQRAN